MAIKPIRKNGKVTCYEFSRMINGNRYHKRFKRKQDAELYEKALLEHHLQDQRRFTTFEGTLSDVIAEYFEVNEIKLKRKENTLKAYKGFARYVLEDPISKRKLIQIDYVTLQSFFNKLCENYSRKTIYGVKALLNLVYKLAIKNGYLERNLVSLVEIHAKSKEEDPSKKYVSPDTFRKIIDTMQSRNESLSFNNYCIALTICYYSGLRISEALALQWKDLDSVNATLNIDKQVHTKGKVDDFHFSDLKTPASKAVLPIPQILVDILQEWRFMNMTSEEDGLIVSCDNRPIAYSAIYGAFKRTCESLGIKHSPHDLRASYITNLLLSGCDIKSLQALARHEKIETTLTFYASTTPEKLRTAVDTAFPYPITQELHNDKMRTS